jgi:hypothetical protein
LHNARRNRSKYSPPSAYFRRTGDGTNHGASAGISHSAYASNEEAPELLPEMAQQECADNVFLGIGGGNFYVLSIFAAVVLYAIRSGGGNGVLPAVTDNLQVPNQEYINELKEKVNAVN